MKTRDRVVLRLWREAVDRRPELLAAEVDEVVVGEVLAGCGRLSPRTRRDYSSTLRRLHRRGQLTTEPVPETEPRRRKSENARTRRVLERAVAEVELAPRACPHCDAADSALILVRHFGSGMRSVVCDADRGGCGASGGWRESDGEAVEAWGVDG